MTGFLAVICAIVVSNAQDVRSRIGSVTKLEMEGEIGGNWSVEIRIRPALVSKAL